MKKNVLIIIGLLLITPCHAQTVIDTVTYRFIYDFQAKIYENSNQLFPDEHWLDIGKNGGSKYYSHWHALRRAVADSIRSAGGDHQDILNEYQKQGLEISHFDYYVYKNYPEPDEQTVILSTAENLQYDEKMGQDWELLDGDYAEKHRQHITTEHGLSGMHKTFRYVMDRGSSADYPG